MALRFEFFINESEVRIISPSALSYTDLTTLQVYLLKMGRDQPIVINGTGYPIVEPQ